MFESLNEAVLSAIVVVAGGALCVLIARSLSVRPFVAAFLYIWHTVIGTYLSNYVLVNGGDAFAYYMRARYAVLELKPGTDFLPWLTSFPVALGFGYWPCSYLYNMAGAVGLVFYYAALLETPAGQVRSGGATLLLLACTLIPSFSLWTSAIGKDSLGLLSVGLLLWSSVKFESRRTAAFAAVVIMFIIRPHIAALMLFAIGVGAVLLSNLKKTVRVGIAAMVGGIATFAVPFALVYAGTTRFETLSDYVSDRQSANAGGSSIDISSMNPVMRVISFLYRPFPNEASGFEQLATSVDNLLLIVLTIFGVVAIYRAGFRTVFRRYTIAAVYGITCLLLLSQVIGNLGLATRQKWMCIPPLLFLFVAAWGMRRVQRPGRVASYRPVPQPQRTA